MKHDSGKVLLHLLPADVLKSVAEVFTYGAKKYGHENFYNDMNNLKYSRYLNAAKRHLLAWEQGENLDEESELHHLDHCITSLMFLRLQTMHSIPHVDDRLYHLINTQKQKYEEPPYENEQIKR